MKYNYRFLYFDSERTLLFLVTFLMALLLAFDKVKTNFDHHILK